LASGGSTAPLWTILLAIGAAARLDPRPWAYVLGTAALALATAAAVRAFRPHGAGIGNWRVWLAIVFALEWHLVWAAASGMEVILLVAMGTLVMLLSLPTVHRPLLVGALVGLGIWIRPDALTLGLIPFLSIALDGQSDLRERTARLLRLAIGAALLALPYLAFNLATAGTIWPSTFYAKQAEYAELRDAPYVRRFLQLAVAPLTGSGILLLPGVVLEAVNAVRERRWGVLGPMLWSLGYLALFAALLPVTYQHGRYQMPILPVLLIFGWQGIHRAFSLATAPLLRVLTRVWAAAVVVVTFAFVLLGARAYAQDVGFIETAMVETARWIADHTDPQARVAAHDIGALGYFGGRPVLDMAGLADREVIPILRDEARLARYLTEAGTAYLMTFPAWYPSLTACAEPVYESDGAFSQAPGGEKMTIYRWPSPAVVPPEGCMLYSP
jgi:hypothetical protein